MEDTYDCVILGTGLTECVLSGLLSVEGKKVLVLDRNDYQGEDCASLNIEALWKHMNEPGTPDKAKYGRSPDYNIDLIPKFLMARGKLAKLLVHTQVTRYLEFKSISGSYVLKDNTIHKVPATSAEALSSGLLGLFEKRRFKDFLQYCSAWEEDDSATHGGVDAHTMSAKKLCEKYKLSDNTVNFVGHTMGLFTTDEYLNQPAYNFIKKVKLYINSLASYGKSPFLYPLYGLGDLPGSFSRMGAVYGSVTIPRRRVDRILYDEKGRVCGVESQGEVVKCQNVIAHPAYVPSEKLQPAGKVVRAICILEHPIPNTHNSDSCQIIIPQKQTGRHSDIYIACVSFANKVAPEGKYIAMVSTTVETKDPNKELEPGLRLLGPIMKQFITVSDLWVPVNDWEREHVFISKSYDATSHFETVCDDILRIYKQYSGQNFDFSKQIGTTLESNTNQ